MTLPLPDVQASSPDIKINLTRVGVNNVKKLVEVARPNGKRPVILISEFHIYVDLPSDIKGANLSRNFEAMYEVLEEALNMPIYEVEELCTEVARRVLQLHEYASTAEVGMKSEYMLKRKTPVMKISCQEPAIIFAEARAFRTDNNELRIKKTIGAEIVGITTCPCAQELMRDKAVEELTKRGVTKEDIVSFLDTLPLATHNQRGRGIISLEVEDNIKLPLGRIINIIEQSMSAKTYEILKRPDEAEVVATAHKKPMFVEDCVRAMAKLVVETFDELPDDSIVTIEQINEESIHQHDAVAERIASIGDLRRELKESDAGVA